MTAVENIFKVGQDWGENEETRITNNLREQKTVIPQASVQPKDHKPIPKTGIPKSRFLISAVSTVNERINQVTTMILQNIVKSDQTSEVGSTENLLYKVEEVIKRIQNGEIDDQKLVLGSLDVTNLYGSLRTNPTCELVRKRVLKSNCKFEGIDLRWALIYLALTLKPHQIVKYKLQQTNNLDSRTR